jgi:hypothetical protein
VRLLFINVNGINSVEGGRKYSKLALPHWREALAASDIIGMSETKLKGEEEVRGVQPGFISTCSHFSRAGRKKGVHGMAGLHRHALSGFVKVVRKARLQGTITYKITRELLGLPRDVYVIYTYLPHEKSTVLASGLVPVDPFDHLCGEITACSADGSVIVMGDLNARTGRLDDRAPSEAADIAAIQSLVHTTGGASLQLQHTLAMPPRANSDVTANLWGRRLINLCISTNMTILNGRIAGTNNNGCTFRSMQHRNSTSTLDYCLASYDLCCLQPHECADRAVFAPLLEMHIYACLEETDHHAVALTLNRPVAAQPPPSTQGDTYLTDEQLQYLLTDGAPTMRAPVWTDDRADAYTNFFVQHEQQVRDAVKAIQQLEDAEQATAALQCLVEKAATATLHARPLQPAAAPGAPSQRSVQQRVHGTWFTGQLRDLRLELRRARSQHGDTDDTLRLQRAYRSRCQQAKRSWQRQHSQDMLTQLISRPKQFYKEYRWAPKAPLALRDPAIWHAYGQQLFSLEQQPAASQQPASQPVQQPLAAPPAANQQPASQPVQQPLAAPPTASQQPATLPHPHIASTLPVPTQPLPHATCDLQPHHAPDHAQLLYHQALPASQGRRSPQTSHEPLSASAMPPPTHTPGRPAPPAQLAPPDTPASRQPAASQQPPAVSPPPHPLPNLSPPPLLGLGADSAYAHRTLNKPTTLGELEALLCRLKLSKAADIHRLKAEHLKLARIVRPDTKPPSFDYLLLPALVHIFNRALATGVYPSQLTLGMVCPLFKKGDALDTDNYRCITIEPIVAKLFNALLDRRANTYLEARGLRAPQQCGFRPQRSCADHHLTLDHIIQTTRAAGHKLFATFIDFRKAFDSVPRERLLARLNRLGFHGNFLRLLKNMYDSSHVQFLIDGQLTPSIRTHRGVLQGDPFSPTLFGIVIDEVIERLGADTSTRVPTLNGQRVFALLYADDLVLLALDLQSAQRQLQGLEVACEATGLEVNLDDLPGREPKSALVIFGGSLQETLNAHTTFKGQSMPVKDYYRYLGLVFTRTQGIGKHAAKCRDSLEKAARFASFSTLARCRQLHLDEPAVAIRLFDQMVLPCLTFGAEVWLPYLDDPWQDLDKHMKTQLEDTQTRFLRSITRIGPKSSTLILLAECGRAPLYLHCLKQACRYWNKLCKLNHTHIARHAFLDSAALAAAGHETWVSRMVTLMQSYEVFDSNIYDCHPLTHVTYREIDLEVVENSFGAKLDAYWAAWKANTNITAHRHKYTTHFKHEHHLDAEAYSPLCDIRLPIHLRRAALRLRSCASRINGNSWGGASRVCPLCESGAVEDEPHFLLHCEAHSVLRVTFGLQNFTSIAPMFERDTIRKTSQFIMAAMGARATALGETITVED